MFFENLKTIAVQVFMLYMIAGIGFAADKFGIFTREDAKRVINLLFNLILPIAVIRSFAHIEYSPEHVRGLFIAFLCAAATHLFGMAVCALTFRKRSLLERGIFHYGTVFSNAAFLALPLAQSVIGDEGVFYCSVYIGVFNIFAFTYGFMRSAEEKPESA